MALRCLQGSDEAVGGLSDRQGSRFRRELDQARGDRIRSGLRTAPTTESTATANVWHSTSTT